MASRYDRALLAMGLGVLLVASSVLAFPGGGPSTRTYAFDAERLGGDEITQAVLDYDSGPEPRAVLRCHDDVATNRLCHFERRLAPNDTTGTTGTTKTKRTTAGAASTTPEPTDSGNATLLDAPYRYVYFPESGFYELQAHVENGTVVASLSSVPPTTVAANVATPYDAAPDVVRRAVDEGNATTTVRTSESAVEYGSRQDVYDEYRSALVKEGDGYYAVHSDERTGREVSRWRETLARLAVFLVGGAAVVWSFAERRRIVDE